MTEPTTFFEPWTSPPSAGAPAVHVSFDPGMSRALGEGLLRPLIDRLEPAISGFENLPKNGPAIVLLNHTGVNAGRDAMVLAQRWSQYAGYDARQLPSTVVPPRLRIVDQSAAALGNAPVFSAILHYAEGYSNAVLKRGGIVLVYPENAADLLSHGTRRGPVTFLPDFVDLAIEHGAPVIPIACLSGESFAWNARDWHQATHDLRIAVGAPLRVTLAAESARHDRERAADAMRSIVINMLHALHDESRKHSSAAPKRPFEGPFSGLFSRFTSPQTPSGFGASPMRSLWDALMPAFNMGRDLAGRAAERATATVTSAAPAAPVAHTAADPPLARRVSALEAEGEVARAMFTWGRALDRVELTKDPADARHIANDLMTEDGVLDFGAVGWGVWGPDKTSLIADILRFSRKIGWAYHTYPNGEITVDLDRGTARYFTSTEVVPLSVSGVFQWYFLTQCTEFRRVSGAWKVARYTLSDLRIAPSPSDRW